MTKQWLKARWWGITVAALMLATLLSRLAFRTRVPANWDAVQYILALSHFDIAKHQPHPPGNPLYVLLGRGAHQLIGDPNQALIAVSIVASLIAVWGTAMLGARLISRAAGLWAAALLAVNPLFWFYGETALSYTPEIAVGVLAGLAAWRAHQRPERSSALLVGLAFALAGGVRPTVLPLLGLLWLFAFWRLGRRDRRVAIGTTLAGCLLWLVPLLALSGGPIAYWTQLHRLTASAVEPTSIIFHGPTMRWWNDLRSVITATVVAFNIFGVIVAYYLVRRTRWRRPHLDRRALVRRLQQAEPRSLFLAAWLLPPLAMFALVHFGQWGYLLLVLPPLLYLGLIQLERTGSLLGRANLARLAPALLASLAIFLLVPEIPTSTGPRFEPTRAGIESHDASWRKAADIIRTLPSANTLIFASADGLQSFRIASYLLPEYDVIGVGRDWHGNWGEMYQAEEGRSTYQLDPTQRAKDLMTASDVGFVVVLDHTLAEKIPDSVFWGRVPLSDGTPLYVRSLIPSTAYVSFLGEELWIVSGTAASAPTQQQETLPLSP